MLVVGFRGVAPTAGVPAKYALSATGRGTIVDTIGNAPFCTLRAIIDTSILAPPGSPVV